MAHQLHNAWWRFFPNDATFRDDLSVSQNKFAACHHGSNRAGLCPRGSECAGRYRPRASHQSNQQQGRCQTPPREEGKEDG